jgi:hypothetical protein
MLFLPLAFDELRCRWPSALRLGIVIRSVEGCSSIRDHWKVAKDADSRRVGLGAGGGGRVAVKLDAAREVWKFNEAPLV